MRLIDMPEYRIWRGIKSRCSNPNVKGYSRYGAKGITIAPEWAGDFQAFLRELGPRPSPQHSVDRIDNSKGYEPGNCRWATPVEQTNNRACTRHVTYRGERLPLTEAVRRAGSVIHREAAWVRIQSGWTVERALETPRLFVSPNGNERRARS